MTGPLYLPTTELVSQAWLRLAVPGVGVGSELPEIGAELRAAGFIRTSTIPSPPDRFVPMRMPVVPAECWWPPDVDSQETPWLSAAQIAERLMAATYDPQLMGVVIDLSAIGSYAPARVHNVIALTEPDRNESDPSDWARYDIDLAFTWTQGA